MVEEGYKRKLAAVICPFVKSYSRLMDGHKEATLRTNISHLTIFNSPVDEFLGRAVGTPGDYNFSESPSIVFANNGAVVVYRNPPERNVEPLDERNMEFRIGIKLSDVMEETGPLYIGRANIAAQREQLAEDGDDCISRKAFDQVANKLGLEYEYRG